MPDIRLKVRLRWILWDWWWVGKICCYNHISCLLAVGRNGLPKQVRLKIVSLVLDMADAWYVVSTTCIALSRDVKVSVFVLWKPIHPSYQENQSILSYKHQILMRFSPFCFKWMQKMDMECTGSFVPRVLEVGARVCVGEANSSRRFKKQNICHCNHKKLDAAGRLFSFFNLIPEKKWIQASVLVPIFHEYLLR